MDGVHGGRRTRGAASAASAVVPAAACVLGASYLVAVGWTTTADGLSAGQLARGVVAGLAYGLPGALVALRDRGSPVGWLMLLVGVSNVGSTVLSVVAHERLVAEPGEALGAWAYWLGSWTWVPGYAVVPALLLLLLPTGAPPSRRWRPVAVLGAAVTALATVAWATTPYDRQDVPVPAEYGDLGNPVGLPGAQLALALSLPILAGCAAAGLVSLVARMRSRTGREREQVAWVLTGALLTVALLVLGFVSRAASDALVAAAMLPIPASIAWATIRRRLWDLDVVVNRGLVTGGLLAGAVAVYGLVLGLAGDLLRDLSRAPDLLAFVVAAVAVQPLALPLQRGVNRVLYGGDVQPHVVVARLGEQLQSASSPGRALAGVVESLARSLNASYAALRTHDGTAVAVGVEPAGTATERLPLVHQGRVVGELAVGVPEDGYGRRERELLAQLVRHAAFAAHAVTLHEEVQRSREQIVGSREEERRRLRHDLHDDLGPGLAATALELETAAELVVDDPDRARSVLERAAGYLRTSVADVRRIVDDLRPVALGELGLVGATREYAARLEDVGLTVVVRSAGDLDRLPAAAEVAAYRIATEAMTNVVRHARATSVEVSLVRGDECLEVRVSDDGVGLAPTVEVGVGMGSMHQRAAELGGTCVVGADPEGGTVVLARMPLGDA